MPDSYMRGTPETSKNPYAFYDHLRAEGIKVYWDSEAGVFQLLDYKLLSEVAISHEFSSAMVAGTSVPIWEAARNPAAIRRRQPSESGLDKAYADLVAYLAQVADAVNAGARTEPVPGRARELIRAYESASGVLLLGQEGPVHVEHRRMVNRWLTPRWVASWEEPTRRVARDLIEKFPADGHVEFMSMFAGPLPGIIISDVMGVPRNENDVFMLYMHNAVGNPAYIRGKAPADEVAHMREQSAAEVNWVSKAIQERKKCPGDDLISKFVSARRSDGCPIPDDSIIGAITLIVAGGQETTAKTLTNSMWMLLQRPDVEAELRADPSLIPAFIDEVLRFQSPVQGMMRVALSDVEFDGVAIPAGSQVQLTFGAANRDPTFYPHANDFDIHRSNLLDHAAFGKGPHTCPGRSLARLEMRIAWEELLKRYSSIKLGRENTIDSVPFFTSNVLRGVRKIWVDFSPT